MTQIMFQLSLYDSCNLFDGTLLFTRLLPRRRRSKREEKSRSQCTDALEKWLWEWRNLHLQFTSLQMNFSFFRQELKWKEADHGITAFVDKQAMLVVDWPVTDGVFESTLWVFVTDQALPLYLLVQGGACNKDMVLWLTWKLHFPFCGSDPWCFRRELRWGWIDLLINQELPLHYSTVRSEGSLEGQKRRGRRANVKSCAQIFFEFRKVAFGAPRGNLTHTWHWNSPIRCRLPWNLCNQNPQNPFPFFSMVSFNFVSSSWATDRSLHSQEECFKFDSGSLMNLCITQVRYSVTLIRLFNSAGWEYWFHVFMWAKLWQIRLQILQIPYFSLVPIDALKKALVTHPNLRSQSPKSPQKKVFPRSISCATSKKVPPCQGLVGCQKGIGLVGLDRKPRPWWSFTLSLTQGAPSSCRRQWQPPKEDRHEQVDKVWFRL